MCMIQVNKVNTGGVPYSPGQEMYFFIAWNTNDPWIQLLWKDPQHWVSSPRHSCSHSCHHTFVVFVAIVNWESLEWSLCFRRVSSDTFRHGERLFKIFRDNFAIVVWYTVIHLPLLSILFAHIYFLHLFYHQVLTYIDKLSDGMSERQGKVGILYTAKTINNVICY